MTFPRRTLLALLLGIANPAWAITYRDPSQNPDFVSLADTDSTIAIEMRYAGSFNFVGRPIHGYKQAKCLLSRAAAEALSAVQKELKPFALSLKVYDCYRPQRAVADFAAWARDLRDLRMKREFYPHVDKALLFKEGYIAEKSGHSRGSTLDLTLAPLPTATPEAYPTDEKRLRDCTLPAEKRLAEGALDMGTGFDCFDPLAHTANPTIGTPQRRNRLLLKLVMEKHGFKNLPDEWWHFTLDHEPYPETYFDFEVE